MGTACRCAANNDALGPAGMGKSTPTGDTALRYMSGRERQLAPGAYQIGRRTLSGRGCHRPILIGYETIVLFEAKPSDPVGVMLFQEC